jgi:hypothetical protein
MLSPMSRLNISISIVISIILNEKYNNINLT